MPKNNLASIVLNNFTHDSRVKKIASTLSSLDLKVTVVALYDPGLAECESNAGFNVHRIKLKSRFWPKKKIFQVFKYFEFIYRAVKKYRTFELLHLNDLSALPIGVLIKVFFNNEVKVIYDAHEFEINHHANQSKFSIKLLYYIERFLIQYADKVITVSESIANEYSSLYGIEKPTLVLNCPFYKNVEESNLLREDLGIRKDQIIYLYQGALGKGRGVECLLDLFSTMEGDSRVIVFMGYGYFENEIKEYSSAYKNIFFHEAVPFEVLLNYTKSADFGLSFIEDICLSYRYCLPNKLFEYLMAEVPVVTSSLVEMKRLVESHEVGVVVKSESIESLNEAIIKVEEYNYNDLQKNVRAIKELYSWEQQEYSLIKVYKSILDEVVI
jgi:glycosyltransferase involved in cell wall biosynthesis